MAIAGRWQGVAYKWPKISRKPNNTPPAPIMVVCSGTAGFTRGRSFCQHMLDSERIERIQSVIVCDYNSQTMDEIKRNRVKFKGRTRRASPIAMIFPEQVKQGDGFMLNPLEFKAEFGKISRELDKMVDEALQQSVQKGRDPQVIIEFMGFGGHSLVGLLLHQKLQKAFPTARMFPVIGIPGDQVLRQWMVGVFQEPTGGEGVVLPSWCNEGVYRAYVKALNLEPNEAALFVDNAVDESPNYRLAAGLATIEAAGTDAVKKGSIPEALGGIMFRETPLYPGDRIKKLNMNVVSVSLEQDRGRLRWSQEQEPRYAVKKACWAVANSGSLLNWKDDLYLAPADTNIYISLPIKDNRLAELQKSLTQELEIEGFFEKRKANITIGSSLYQSVPKGELKVTAAALESLSVVPHSLVQTFNEYQPEALIPEEANYRPGSFSENGLPEFEKESAIK